MVDSRASSDSQTSMTLIGRLRLQDPVAWRQVAELYGPLVYSWVRISGLNEHDAADIVQEVFVAVHSSLDRFRKDKPADRFRDWLWTITRRRTYDHFRKVGKQVLAQGGLRRLSAIAGITRGDSWLR